jgi:hypothetical protein
MDSALMIYLNRHLYNVLAIMLQIREVVIAQEDIFQMFSRCLGKWGVFYNHHIHILLEITDLKREHHILKEFVMKHQELC